MNAYKTVLGIQWGMTLVMALLALLLLIQKPLAGLALLGFALSVSPVGNGLEGSLKALKYAGLMLSLMVLMVGLLAV